MPNTRGRLNNSESGCYVTVILVAVFAFGLHADTLNPLASAASTGTDGSFTSVLTNNQPYWGTSYVLNTDSGQVFAGGYAGNGYLEYSSGPLATFGIQQVTQPDGSTVNVFNFSTFNVPQGFTLTTTGSAAAALLAQNDAQIAGNIIVRNANQPGASNPNVGNGPLGGGNGGNGWGYVTANTYGFAGSGGGGGLVIQGGGGYSGVPQIVGYNNNVPIVYWPSGGAGGAAGDLNNLQGGGAGGLGGHGCGYCTGVAAGGYGGGALLFGDNGNFTITASGSITADGGAGQLNYSDGASGGAGGGGAGGYLWFNVAGTWDNEGAVIAEGGAGATDNGQTFSNYFNAWDYGPFLGGAGAGGFVNIDPQSIVNNGIIDVAGGFGDNTGLVDFGVLPTGSGEIDGSLAPEPDSFALLGIPLVWIAAGRALKRA